jgi:chromosome partitioning protein
MSSTCKVVSFVSASGGVGKTTLAIFLAKWLVEQRYVSPLKLLILDLDPTAGLSLSLMDEDKYDDSLTKGSTMVNLFRDYSKGLITRKISDYVTPVKHEGVELNILPPGEDLEQIVEELWNTGRPGPEFREVLEKSGAYNLYDFIIIDSAPFFDVRYTVLSIYAATRYVVVLRPSIVDSRRTARMLRRLMKYEKDFGLSTSDYLARFLGVINLAKSGTIEADALLNLKFIGVKPSRGFNLFKHPSDERRKNLEKSIEGLKSLINFSKYVLPLNADISRLEFKEIIKGGKSDDDLKNTTENLLKDIWLHATCKNKHDINPTRTP